MADLFRDSADVQKQLRWRWSEGRTEGVRGVRRGAIGNAVGRGVRERADGARAGGWCVAC
jgi:hypothetical protein